VRKKYVKFEGSLKGIDSRILVAQVPGGMLTNLENQLREQNAAKKLDEVLEEIPKVREDLGFIPLVTPTSQIVGTQAVLNVISGERYRNITKETEGVLKGEYGATPAPMNQKLQAKVLNGKQAINCRPADLLEPEFEKQKADLIGLSEAENITLKNEIDDTLTYALFPQIGWRFLKNRDNSEAFEAIPSEDDLKPARKNSPEVDSGIYTVEVEGKSYMVRVSEGGDISQLAELSESKPSAEAPATSGEIIEVAAPLAGNVFRVAVDIGDNISEGEIILVLEAMKMETEIRSTSTGIVTQIFVASGDAVKVGDVLLTLS